MKTVEWLIPRQEYFCVLWGKPVVNVLEAVNKEFFVDMKS